MGEGFNFEKLTVYRKAIELTHKIYEITKKFPDKEIFGLTNQIRRASVSIALNIAEGSGKGKKEFAHYLDIARGSVFESLAAAEISLHECYISQQLYNDIRLQLEELSKMISGLKRSLKAVIEC
jgi:four helix bundle protein